MNFFICGTHTCGKSSIIHRLKKEGLIEYAGDELGKRLFYEQKFSTENQGPEFEKSLAAMELDRDILVSDNIELSGAVLETWHPGNLAYALHRNPNVSSELLDIYSKSPLQNKIKGIWLNMESPEVTIFQRTKTFEENKEWAVRFYVQIQSLIGEALNMMNLNDKVTIINVERPFDDVYSDIKKIIQESNRF